MRSLSKVASTAIIAGAALVAIPAAAVAAPAAPTNASESCIPEGGGIGTGKPNPVDGQANVYVGGNFELVSGAELEGLLVVQGNAKFGGAGLYNTGVVGVGSLLTPPAMSDMIVVGGDMTVGAERRLDVGSLIGGGVRVGGTVAAKTNAIDTNGAELVSGVGKAAALGEWASLGGVLTQQSKSYADMPATGTATVQDGTLTLTGDGTTKRQVFTLDGSKLASFGSMKYQNINPQAIVVVNVTGDTAKFKLTSVLHPNGMPMDPGNIDKGAFGSLTQRLLWNFPTAKDVLIGGTAQFPGSFLVQNPASTTTVQVPGTNGRMWVAGNLVHNLGTGSEMHAFPFLDGDVFGCDPTMPEVKLVSPTIEQSVCTADGKATTPKVTLPKSTELSYALSGKVAAGETVTVTATSLTGGKIAALKGWTLAKDALSATFTVTLDDVACDQPVAPVAPEVAQAVCTEDGSATAPTVTLAETAGISYAIEGEVEAGATVTVTATAEKGSLLTAAEGWILADDKRTATTKVKLAEVACDQPVAPVTPEVAQAVCTEDGSATAPTVTLAETAGVSYAIDGEVKAGATVTVTATAEKGSFLTAAKGWTLADDKRTATTKVTLENVVCDQPVAPVTPTVAQAVCTEDGSATAPTVTLAETAGVSYAIDGEVKAGATVTVTATAKKGSFLTKVEGWILADDKRTATTKVTLAEIVCDQPGIPVLPTVTQAECVGDGTATAPTVTPAVTAGVIYEVLGDPATEESVTVTATAADGHFLKVVDGWEYSEDGLTASVRIVFDEIACDQPVAPVAPEVTQAVCTEDGSATAPTVALAETAGVSYAIDGEVKAGATVTVTATANEGSFLTAAEGWTLAEDKRTATIEFALEDVVCDQPVTPVAPEVTQAVCTEEGSVTAPVITLAETDGIVYAVDGKVEPGETVTITATPTDGFFLTPAEGWEETESGAQMTLELGAVGCSMIPETPQPSPATEDTPVPPAGLAASGAGTLPAIGIGAAALMILGVSALLVTRARRSRSIAE